MRAVDIRVGHDNDAVIPQAVGVELVSLYATRANTDREGRWIDTIRTQSGPDSGGRRGGGA